MLTSSTLTSDVYIQKHNVPTLFWPDLASWHYSHKTIDWYERYNVSIVNKGMNPPNSPKFPSEKCWAIVTHILKDMLSCKNDKTMLYAWNNCVKKVIRNVVQCMVSSIGTGEIFFYQNMAHHYQKGWRPLGNIYIFKKSFDIS